MSAVVNGRRFVAVGNEVTASTKWNVFNDFLHDLITSKLGPEWIAAETAKPPEAQHPIIVWRSIVRAFLASLPRNELGYAEAKPIGAAAAYFGLAYSLYLIQHNAELLEHMLNRLRVADQFQGAYFELVMINCLVRAGFKIDLVDETQRNQRHVELYATSPTGRRYSVEVKARAVAGVLGKTAADGTPDPDPTNRIRKHLSDALNKPSQADRMVFIDLNAADGADGTEPPWYPRARQHLFNKERERPNDPPAYVFITNFCYHHHLNSDCMATFICPYGFHIADFLKAERITLFDAYKQEQKHADAHSIVRAMQTYTYIPTTFDGSLPSEIPGMKVERRPMIGQLYRYDPADDDTKAVLGPGLEAFSGIVTTAIASKEEMCFYFSVRRDDGHEFMLTQRMSDRQLIEWEQYKETYFGVMQHVGKGNCKPYEMFEFFIRSYRHAPRAKIEEHMKCAPDIEELKKLSDEDLLLRYCERLVGAMKAQNPDLLAVRTWAAGDRAGHHR
ncbi:hypothetical protein J4558_18110 [Leptolyngbya sp. 15MV]|nr:hypothetical protein J4558_18110 [Leptolyngbya sp. 15MV]